MSLVMCDFNRANSGHSFVKTARHKYTLTLFYDNMYLYLKKMDEFRSVFHEEKHCATPSAKHGAQILCLFTPNAP